MQGSISQDNPQNSVAKNSELTSSTSSENVAMTGDPHSQPTSLASSVNLSCEVSNEGVQTVSAFLSFLANNIKSTY